MESIKELFKIGHGPSSSHTMGPAIASEKFLNKNPNATHYKCILYGSLAQTGKGHLTDYIIEKVFRGKQIEVKFDYTTTYEYHPNAMRFIAYKKSEEIDNWLVFSVGGGTLKELDEERSVFKKSVYPHNKMSDILEYCKDVRYSLADYVLKYEESDILEYLDTILARMKRTVQKGIFNCGILPGGLNVSRKGADFYHKYLANPSIENLVFAYALATSEENAAGHKMVTAPTCGSCGVVPAVLLSYQEINKASDEEIKKALMVAGLIGNIVKTNASISGAEVGCQGEVGVACAMAAGALTYLVTGKNEDIEYAAEIALEHHLGMTCDPIDGLVQIPCIERNAIAAMQAYNACKYVEIAGSEHFVTFDSVVTVMNETGKDLHAKYRETATGGLAIHNRG